jgi:hypothetical protein
MFDDFHVIDDFLLLTVQCVSIDRFVHRQATVDTGNKHIVNNVADRHTATSKQLEGKHMSRAIEYGCSFSSLSLSLSLSWKHTHDLLVLQVYRIDLLIEDFHFVVYQRSYSLFSTRINDNRSRNKEEKIHDKKTNDLTSLSATMIDERLR